MFHEVSHWFGTIDFLTDSPENKIRAALSSRVIIGQPINAAERLKSAHALDDDIFDDFESLLFLTKINIEKGYGPEGGPR